MGDKYVGPRGRMPNYRNEEGERIRALLESKSPAVRKSVESALLEMGADPFTARHYGKNGGDPDEISKYLKDTAESRRNRLRKATPPRSSVRGQPSPWNVE